MIDKSKLYRTRDGREVRIYAVDGGAHGNAIHGAVKNESGRWIATQWFHEGMYAHAGSHMNDLIEVPPRIKRKVWMNVYETDQPITWLFRNKALAESAAASCKDHRIACVEVDIDVEEGHGL